MKTSRSLRWLSPALALIAALLLSGCLENKLVWSPDGSRGALLSKRSVYLCSPEGSLSGPFLENIDYVAWTRDSAGLLLASKDVPGGQDAQTQQKAPTALRVQLSRLVDGKVTPGTVLWENKEYKSIAALRPSPDGSLLALTVESNEEKGSSIHLLVLRLDGTGAPLKIAERCNGYPDWTPDSRSLVFLQSMAPEVEKTLELGVLKRRQIRDDAGALTTTKEPVELAGGLFQSTIRVRCLPDGRILFNNLACTIPMALADRGDSHEQFFMLDEARYASLIGMVPRRDQMELPDGLTFYEPSPDGTRLLVSSSKNRGSLVTLATGGVTTINPENKEKNAEESILTAQWRTNEEFSFVRYNAHGEKPRWEIVLRSGDKERILSKDWPEDVLKGLVK
jgi:hypothetical protein